MKKVLMIGMICLSSLGFLGGCKMGIEFRIGFNEEGGFGYKETENGRVLGTTTFIQCIDEMKALCNEWNNPAYEVNDTGYSNSLSRKIRGYDNSFFEENFLITCYLYKRPDENIKVKEIRNHGSELQVIIHRSSNGKVGIDLGVSWLLLIEVTKTEITIPKTLQIIEK